MARTRGFPFPRTRTPDYIAQRRSGAMYRPKKMKGRYDTYTEKTYFKQDGKWILLGRMIYEGIKGAALCEMNETKLRRHRLYSEPFNLWPERGRLLNTKINFIWPGKLASERTRPVINRRYLSRKIRGEEK